MFGLGVGEILIIFVVALIFIGPKKLPELAKGLGKAMREFQNAAKGITDSINIKEDLNKIQNDIESSVKENIQIQPESNTEEVEEKDATSNDTAVEESSEDKASAQSVPRK